MSTFISIVLNLFSELVEFSGVKNGPPLLNSGDLNDHFEWFWVVWTKKLEIHEIQWKRSYQLCSFDSLTLHSWPCHWPPRQVSCSEGLPPAPSTSCRGPRPWGSLTHIPELSSIKELILYRPSFWREFIQNSVDCLECPPLPVQVKNQVDSKMEDMR